jgi:guanylate kinase
MEIEKILSSGVNALLIIDTAGVRQILAKKNPFPITTIFLAPKNIDELRARIVERRSETVEAIEKRLQTAENELKNLKMYDHVIISGSRDDDLASILKIYAKESQLASPSEGET